MPKILVIADDLTGALDSAVAFATAGCPVPVARRVGDLASILLENPDIVSVNTGTREADTATVRYRMDLLLAAVDITSFDVVLKKIDSRLKGHVGLETAILSHAMGGCRVVAAPAIPAMGRVQSAGQIMGAGLAAPMDIASVFEQPIEVSDIAIDADLDDLVAHNRGALWVGARGLAFALARKMIIDELRARRVPQPVPPLLIAIGSRDPITMAQAVALDRLVRICPAFDGRLIKPPPTAPVVAVQLVDGGGGRTPQDAAHDYAAGIVDWMVAHRPGTLLVTGGETADTILAQLGIGRLDLAAEVAEGLPICECSAPWGTLRVVTKSGGFGGPNLLVDIAGQYDVAQMGKTR